MISRRTLIVALGMTVAIGPTARGQGRSRSVNELPFGLDENFDDPGSAALFNDWYIGTIPDHPYPVPVVDLNLISPIYHRQTVDYEGPESPGTIVIETERRLLYLVQESRTALRYGIGVGREGFAWSGTAEVRRKAKWPSWRPPAEMLRRRPDLPNFMEGGIDNPLGARALYLFQGEQDTLYRIHGTNEPGTIGHAVSSGCIRLLNQDVYDLYGRVAIGTRVTVQQSG